MKTITTTCCISGGGPAGVMLGFLLARSGIDVVVLEKWPDFFRDFRGDTIHPSTMELMSELGILEEFLKLPHENTYQIEGDIGNEKVIVADFSHLKVKAPFVAFMPQWDFLNFITGKAKKYPGFHLMMNTEATDLISETGKIVGVRAVVNDGKGNPGAEPEFEIRADLVVGADGRSSTVRDKSGLNLISTGVPIDVLWFRISKKESDPPHTLGRFDAGKVMIMIDRTTYWQCGFVIRKGAFEEMKTAGLESFRNILVVAAPFLQDRVNKEITTWEPVKLLSVTVNHLERWYKPGFVCIGDAAHAMSPIGGVGINLAVQDAVAAANILAKPLKNKSLTETDLAKIQQRREFPARLIQRAQVFIQNRVITSVLESTKTTRLPFPLRLVKRFPYLRRIPAYFIGMGIRPEHINTPLP
jgi:2-polyprenyl-6-methoxyphenol hydroxylase-like FAD-dependent oxidoreductase